MGANPLTTATLDCQPEPRVVKKSAPPPPRGRTFASSGGAKERPLLAGAPLIVNVQRTHIESNVACHAASGDVINGAEPDGQLRGNVVCLPKETKQQVSMLVVNVVSAARNVCTQSSSCIVRRCGFLAGMTLLVFCWGYMILKFGVHARCNSMPSAECWNKHVPRASSVSGRLTPPQRE